MYYQITFLSLETWSILTQNAYKLGHVQCEVVFEGHGVDADVWIALFQVLIIRGEQREHIVHLVYLFLTQW